MSASIRSIHCGLSIGLCLITSALVAQVPSPRSFAPELGFKFGYSVADELLPEGDNYSPSMLLFTYRRPFSRKHLERRHNWGWYAEPQLVPVHLDNDEAPASERPREIEFGINLGVRYDLHLGQRWTYFAGLGSGPHFITTTTDLQSSGFIFSDNLFIGVTFLPMIKDQRFGVVAEFRVRHISNAGLKASNAGIDNMFAVLGISWRLERAVHE